MAHSSIVYLTHYTFIQRKKILNSILETKCKNLVRAKLSTKWQKTNVNLLTTGPPALQLLLCEYYKSVTGWGDKVYRHLTKLSTIAAVHELMLIQVFDGKRSADQTKIPNFNFNLAQTRSKLSLKPGHTKRNCQVTLLCRFRWKLTNQNHLHARFCSDMFHNGFLIPNSVCNRLIFPAESYMNLTTCRTRHCIYT